MTGKKKPHVKKTRSEGNTHTNEEPKIAHSALSVTLGQRLRKRAPMKKIKDD